MTIDADEFRQALSRFVTGVCLVTVSDPDRGPLATTVNSFSSVSLEPALVLWSIQNSSDHLQTYTECHHFGISVLPEKQGALSGHYAQRGGHDALPEHFTFGSLGEPQLIDALAHFSCSNFAVYPGGDHQIIVGEVVAFESVEAAPLVFFNGGYRSLSGQ
ncbi:MAG: flavin reductase family protein [Luminiphilus sp.]|jgi:flavin reductase (DIM6/NTAB) family NADH-FMN oxidoreductase RutF|nr:flavin reductase family protein [Luminiphilus sp.]